MGPGSGRFPVRGSYLVRGLGNYWQNTQNQRTSNEKDLLIPSVKHYEINWGTYHPCICSKKNALKGPSLKLTRFKLDVAKFSTKLILNLCKLMVEYWDHWKNTLKYDMFGRLHPFLRSEVWFKKRNNWWIIPPHAIRERFVHLCSKSNNDFMAQPITPSTEYVSSSEGDFYISKLPNL